MWMISFAIWPQSNAQFLFLKTNYHIVIVSVAIWNPRVVSSHIDLLSLSPSSRIFLTPNTLLLPTNIVSVCRKTSKDHRSPPREPRQDEEPWLYQLRKKIYIQCSLLCSTSYKKSSHCEPFILEKEKKMFQIIKLQHNCPTSNLKSIASIIEITFNLQ